MTGESQVGYLEALNLKWGWNSVLIFPATLFFWQDPLGEKALVMLRQWGLGRGAFCTVRSRSDVRLFVPCYFAAVITEVFSELLAAFGDRSTKLANPSFRPAQVCPCFVSFTLCGVVSAHGGKV
jgi:hypothetical protein